MTYFLILGMVVAATAEALCWKKNQRGPLDTLIGSALWGAIIATPVLLITLLTADDVFQHVTLAVIGHTLLVNLFTMICIMAWVMVLKNMPISIAKPISLVRLVFLTFFSWLIFGGELGAWQIIMVGLIFVFCSSLGYLQGKDAGTSNTMSCTSGPLGQCGPSCVITCKANPDFKKGLLYMGIWVTSLIALEMFAKTVMETGIRSTTYVFVRFWLLFIVVIPLLFIYKNGFKKTKAACLDKYVIAIGILWATVSTFFNTLLGQGMNVGIVSAINTASVPLVIIGGVLIFREKVKWYSYIFIALILACAVVLSLL